MCWNNITWNSSIWDKNSSEREIQNLLAGLYWEPERPIPRILRRIEEDRYCKKPSAIPSCSDLEHIFAPLFSAPVSVRISLLKLKVLEILIYLSNMKSEHKELTQYFSQQTELIKEIHKQLTEQLDQRFTIAELSKQYLINTSTLKEIFKAVYGQPIATYMKEFRVRQAMKLLRETNATIADIASQVGYQTQGKFSSAFQSIVKMSPREYRKIQSIAPSDSFSKTS